MEVNADALFGLGDEMRPHLAADLVIVDDEELEQVVVLRRIAHRAITLVERSEMQAPVDRGIAATRNPHLR